MVCKYCNSEMENFNSTPNYSSNMFADYICPHCLARMYVSRGEQQWVIRTDWCDRGIFAIALAHLITNRGYSLVKGS